jgi:hypothetical protein
MGYTHYVSRAKDIDHDEKTWDIFIKNCKELYKNMPEYSMSSGGYHVDDPLHLGGCFSYQKPQFTKRHVYFNGSSVPPTERVKKVDEDGQTEWTDPDNKDMRHETFVLTRKAGKPNTWSQDDPTLFSFCKTARKPYDLMVQACLILYKYYFPEVEIGSDGENEDWAQAFAFVAEVLPHGKAIGTELLIGDSLFGKAS